MRRETNCLLAVLWLPLAEMIILEQANRIVETTLKERFALAKEGCVQAEKYCDSFVLDLLPSLY